MFVANKLLAAKGKKLDIVCQAEMIDCFKGISLDISKLVAAQCIIPKVNKQFWT
ncbi:MAG: hypothetical protein MZV64_26725 [Ignavibacteriales bacterium]|nr:hypothetical protein [Ignavibacteriales bacterium]